MKFIVLACLVLFVAGNCNKNAFSRLPACIQDKIAAIAQQHKYNPPATVYRYLYQDRYVYLVSSDCCDQNNYLFDKDCQLVCAPTGGITGKGDGKCPNFKQLATDETLVWKDDR
jgi:hypothetical protein